MMLWTMLLTAFGPFPGHPVNPTPAVLDAVLDGPLARRDDVRLVGRILPTTWAALDDLAAILDETTPDLALHLGLAGRARTIRVETRGRNFAEASRPDAAGLHVPDSRLETDGPAFRRATIPTRAVAAALAASGLRCSLSRDAGDYLCNALLYRSLALAPATRNVGFIHVPPTREMRASAGRAGRAAPSIAEIADGVAAAAACMLSER